MASELLPFKLKIPPRTHIRLPRSFRRYDSLQEEDEGGGLFKSGKCLQVFELPSKRSRSDTWTAKWQSRKHQLRDSRPIQFRNIWMELVFIYSICMPGLLAEYFLFGFVIVLPRFEREHFSTTQSNNVDFFFFSGLWPFIAFPMTIGIFMLSFGRISNKLGNHTCHVGGLTWLAIWSLVAGYARSYWLLCFIRGVSGLGMAAVLAPGSAFIDEAYSAGKRKLFVSTTIRISSIVGVFWGALMASLVSLSSSQHSGWYFWIGALHALSAIIASLISIPNDWNDKRLRQQHLVFDWIGTSFLVFGLFLVLFAIVQAPFTTDGWSTAYIPCLLIIGLTLLGNLAHVESCGYATKDPLLPALIFRRPAVNYLLLFALFAMGCQTGAFYLWTTKFLQQVLESTSLQTVAYCLPYCLVGAITTAIVLKLLPNHHWNCSRPLLMASQVATLVSTMLLAISRRSSSYWSFAFPSMLLAGFAVAASSATASVLTASSVSQDDQRLADTLITASKYIGITLFVGIAGNIQSVVLDGNEKNIESSLKSVFWFLFACAGFSIVLAVLATRKTFRVTSFRSDFHSEFDAQSDFVSMREARR